MSNLSLRFATDADAPAVLAIYAPFVRDTTVSFEYDVPSVEEYAGRMRSVTAQYPWLVAEQDGNVVGYAYASQHRARTAYQWSAEVSVYLAPALHRRGVARWLYTTLFNVLRVQGYVNVYAGITWPNPASVGFHRAMGFTDVGVFKNVGYKFGAWHDTIWLQHTLLDNVANPPAPRALPDVVNSAAVREVLEQANKR